LELEAHCIKLNHGQRVQILSELSKLCDLKIVMISMCSSMYFPWWV